MGRSISSLYVNESLFWSRVDKTEDCWNWTASTVAGYGQFWIGRKTDKTRTRFQAHRIAYELALGPIPESATIDHLCRNRRCVNPNHLEPVTHQENILRGHTLPAANAKKTHCMYGHPLAHDNLYLYRGARQCRECRRRRTREWHRRMYADPAWREEHNAKARLRYSSANKSEWVH